MIYLIDDKDERQQSLYSGEWKRIIENNSIKLIYSKNELDEIKLEIFKSCFNNVILFHESFFLNPINSHYKNSDRIIQDLTNAAQNGIIKVVFFGGAIPNRIFENEYLCFAPVEIIYSNLDVFLMKYEEDNLHLKYILYGENFQVEELFLLRNKIWEELLVVNDNDLVKQTPILFEYIEELLVSVDKKTLIEEFEVLLLDQTISSGNLKFRINKLIKDYQHE